MTSQFSNSVRIFTFLFSIFVIQNAYANVNAIDFTKINYPKTLQTQIDFLRANDGIYNHWVHDWGYKTSKTTVVKNLTFLYVELEKLQPKNSETELLLGDVSHYLYNMEVDAYYQKAVDHYLQAKAYAPEDYRVYWFLGNHYALSANQVLSIQTYQTAMKHAPHPAHELFWADYAVACANASMTGTALYAAHQSSLLAGKKTYIEEQISTVAKSTLKSPPADTTIEAKNMWSVDGKEGNKLLFVNRYIGTRMAVDSTWNLDIGEYKNHLAYVTLAPHTAMAKNGKPIGYSILILTKVPDANESLQQFLDKFSPKSANRKPLTFSVGNIKSDLGYEILDPSVYSDVGGGHMYAFAIQRNQPEFPGLALEAPAEIPKNGKPNELNYYRNSNAITHIKSKLYYFILLDSCEYIHDESLAVFQDFLNSLVLE